MNSTLIDFISFREELELPSAASQKEASSDDLASAIQALIQRLRDSNPIRDVENDDEL